MSFLRNKGRQYTNQSREEQFLRYFRDSGASQALQKAMVLLFNMPIKPANLATFFAEYLDNGAKELVNLSLLKAELCYKLSETENIQQRITHLENQIEKYEGQGYGKGRPSRQIDADAGEEEHLVLDADKDNPIRYSMLDRFLVDLDERPQSQGPSNAPSTQELEDGEGEETKNENDQEPIITKILRVEDDDDSENGDLLLKEDDSGQESVVGSEEALRLKEQESLTNWNNDIKKLDPWGVVCTTKTLNNNNAARSFELEEGLLQQAIDPNSNGPEASTKLQILVDNNTDQERQLGMMPSEVISMGKTSASDSEKSNESDDAETLAEVYNAYATAFDKFPSHEKRASKEGPPNKEFGRKPVTTTTPTPIHHIYRLSNHWKKNDLVVPPNKEKDVKLLSVAQPRKPVEGGGRASGGRASGGGAGDAPPQSEYQHAKHLGEMMGWGKDFCRKRQSQDPSPVGDQKFVPINTNPSEFPQPNWSQYTEIYGENEAKASSTPIDPCLEDVDFYRDIKWQDDAVKAFPLSATDESFLLDYEMARLARKLGTKDDPGFMFEFYQNFDPSASKAPGAAAGATKEEASFCQNCQKWKMKQSRRAAGQVVDLNVGTSTTGLSPEDGDIYNILRMGKVPGVHPDIYCHCEDCTCICAGEGGDFGRRSRSIGWSARFSKNIPGKMINWTKLGPEEAPPEYLDDFDEEEDAVCVCTCGCGEDCSCFYGEGYDNYGIGGSGGGRRLSWKRRFLMNTPGKMTNWTKEITMPKKITLEKL